MSNQSLAPRLHQTEVQYLGFAFRRQLHIGGFQVAVNDALLVRCFQRFGDLLRNGEGFFNRDRTLSLDAIRQRLAGNQLHHEVGCVVGIFDDVVRGDVLMIQRCQQLCFPPKTSEPISITSEGFWQNLDGDVAPELGVMPYTPRPYPRRQLRPRADAFRVLCLRVVAW
jgi:hypothetical protein